MPATANTERIPVISEYTRKLSPCVGEMEETLPPPAMLSCAGSAPARRLIETCWARSKEPSSVPVVSRKLGSSAQVPARMLSASPSSMP